MTSKVVGHKIVRIAWKIVIGMITCAQIAQIWRSHGGHEYGLNRFTYRPSFIIQYETVSFLSQKINNMHKSLKTWKR